MCVWFRNNTSDENDKIKNKEEINENEEVMERIFKMMETITKRIMII